MKVILKTPRLLLRELTTGDAAFLLELMNERPYIENIGDRGVRSVADAERYIDQKYLASYARHGFGLFLVEQAEGSAPMGICGLLKRDALDRPDLGFAYLQRFWSRGYATEAAVATLGHAWASLNLDFLYGLVSAANARSIQLLKRLGFAYVRSSVLSGQTSESHIYGVKLAAPPLRSTR